MKYVLIIAYHFPPGGGPGVQRVLKHVTYLRDFGWQPIVLTVENGDFPARDESLLKKIPPDVRVERVPIFEPYSFYRSFMGKKGAAVDVNVNKAGSERKGWKEAVAEFIRATFFIPDARIGWLRKATQRGVEIVKELQPQASAIALYSSSPPYTCALIGRNIKRRTGLKWVAGFRDPWTGFLTTPDRWFLPASIDKAMERSVFMEADQVECAWQGIIDDALAKVPAANPAKFHHVPNGFDSADFPQVVYERNERFTVTYTGSMYGRRTPRAFLKALEELLREGRLDPAKVRLRFVGRFGDDVREMIETSPLAPSIETVDYVPHTESIAFLMRSELSLLIVDEAKESAEIVPGKVYEYLGVGRPVLALAPEGSAIEMLIEETQAGFSRPQSDIHGIANVFITCMERWERGESIAHPDTEQIRKYERRESARQLARILDEVTLTQEV